MLAEPTLRRAATLPASAAAPMVPAVRKFASDAALQQKDGVFQLDSVEKELVHESFTVDTRDHEDHTFCGIMFKVECDTDLPGELATTSALSPPHLPTH